MSEIIRVRFAGGLPACGAGVVLFAPAMEEIETALSSLGWTYRRIFFYEAGCFNVSFNAASEEKHLAHYRNAGLDERYISVTPLRENNGLEWVKISNLGFDEDPAQEQLIRSLWLKTKGPGGNRELVYSGISLRDKEGAESCDIKLCGGRICVYVTVCDGYGRRTAWRIAEIFADAIGMKIDRKMSKSVRRGIL